MFGYSYRRRLAIAETVRRCSAHEVEEFEVIFIFELIEL